MHTYISKFVYGSPELCLGLPEVGFDVIWHSKKNGFHKWAKFFKTHTTIIGSNHSPYDYVHTQAYL